MKAVSNQNPFVLPQQAQKTGLQKQPEQAQTRAADKADLAANLNANFGKDNKIMDKQGKLDMDQLGKSLDAKTNKPSPGSLVKAKV